MTQHISHVLINVVCYYRRSGNSHVNNFSRDNFSLSYIFVVGAIHDNLSPGLYHCDEYGRGFWLVASAFIVKSGRELLQKYSCERATAARDRTCCGGKKDTSISMERSSDTFNTYRGRINCTV